MLWHNGRNSFHFYDNFTFHKDIRDVVAHRMPLIRNRQRLLPLIGDIHFVELNTQGIFINLFGKSLSKNLQDIIVSFYNIVR